MQIIYVNQTSTQLFRDLLTFKPLDQELKDLEDQRSLPPLRQPIVIIDAQSSPQIRYNSNLPIPDTNRYIGDASNRVDYRFK